MMKPSRSDSRQFLLAILDKHCCQQYAHLFERFYFADLFQQEAFEDLLQPDLLTPATVDEFTEQRRHPNTPPTTFTDEFSFFNNTMAEVKATHNTYPSSIESYRKYNYFISLTKQLIPRVQNYKCYLKNVHLFILQSEIKSIPCLDGDIV